jgi:hypothetical protein
MAMLRSYVHTRKTAERGSTIDKSMEHFRGDQSLAETDPEIAAQWHHHKNGNWTPDQFTYGSKRKIWWICDQGDDHIWPAVIHTRTRRGRGAGCPYCAGKKPSKEYNLGRVHEDVAAEWHSTKNGKLRPEQFLPKSQKDAWWQCAANTKHVWKASIADRTNSKSGCPYCSGHRVSNTNRFSSLFPQLAKEWHPTKNKALTSKDVSFGARKKIWWQCTKEGSHAWLAAVSARTKNNVGCPYCASKRACRTNCLATLHPDIAQEWHPIKNGDLSAKDITPGSQKVIWWLCSNDKSHEWHCRVNDRVSKGARCPFCSGRKVCTGNSLAKLFPDLAREWHPTKNRSLTADAVTPSQGKRVWWQCSKKHEWITGIHNRTSNKSECPYCAGKKATPECNLLKANPELAAQWHKTKNGKLMPDQYRPFSQKKVWWQCKSNKEHIWQAPIARRSFNGAGCPFCCGRAACNTNSLATNYPELAQQLHPTKNGSLTARDLTAHSNKKVWWLCPKDNRHSWIAKPNDRVQFPNACPFCRGQKSIA